MLAVNVAVGLALLLALEGAVRLLRPDIAAAGTDAALLLDRAFVDADGETTGLRPGAVGEANGVPVRVDGAGFHLYAGNAAVPDSAGAWLWLGDSVLFGVGVAQDSTVAGRLAARQDTARVLNPAVLGWGTADYRRRLDAALAAGLRPDRVTLLWCLNDADPARPAGAGDVPRPEDVRRRGKMWLNVHSRLYRFAKDLALDRPARYFAHDGALYEPLAVSASARPEAPVDRALAPLWALVDTLGARGIPLDVAVAPYEPQLRPGGSRAPQAALVARLRARGVPTLDLFDAFAQAAGDDPAALYLWSDGIHFSARGHAVAAEAVARWRPER
ncbi:SGNH/GDSL hydrolase family protein [Rubrivirga sp.]|uniref:SGNH/GDSL hydrolase family protein n=1 Tax=Rubrivirga sp. TaxID=1885344 RepID=UPI003B527691